MNARSILAVLGLVLVLHAVAAPAQAGRQVEAPVITSAVAVDSRTVDITWDKAKGADFYIVSSLAGQIVTKKSETSARITNLYPGAIHDIYVTSEYAGYGVGSWVSVATPVEGPTYLSAYLPEFDVSPVLSSDSGNGCVAYDLGVLADDGTYTSLGGGPNRYSPTWEILMEHGDTATYASRCQGGSGIWSPWTPPVVVTVP